jgi:hypothetical protein
VIQWEGDLPFLMISSETPYKLAEIIRDTWPQLYRPPKPPKKKKNV